MTSRESVIRFLISGDQAPEALPAIRETKPANICQQLTTEVLSLTTAAASAPPGGEAGSSRRRIFPEAFSSHVSSRIRRHRCALAVSDLLVPCRPDRGLRAIPSRVQATSM